MAHFQIIENTASPKRPFQVVSSDGLTIKGTFSTHVAASRKVEELEQTRREFDEWLRRARSR